VNSPRNHLRNVQDEPEQKPVSSTISRYSCRIIFSRDQSGSAHVYAAGFNSSKNIFLGVNFIFIHYLHARV